MIKSILTNKYGQYLKGLDIYENKTSLILSRIIIKDEFRDEGIGSKIMTDLVNYADKNKQIVALTPSSDFGGSKNRLTQFYKRFGFKPNKGQYKSYEFRDAMIRYPKLGEIMNEDEIKGGLAGCMTIQDLAKKHDVTVKEISTQLVKGIKVELEHTDDEKLSKEIAMDHLFEDPKYYDKLETIEESSYKARITTLLREAVELSVTDETAFNTEFDIYFNGRRAGVIGIGRTNPILAADTLEISTFKLENAYENINVANQAVKSLWAPYPDAQRMVVNIPPQSTHFWEKLGFQRLNDTFHMLMRGH